MSVFTDIQSFDCSRVSNIYVKNGYVLYSSERNKSVPNIATGGCYQKGNIIYDLTPTNDNGTIIGSPVIKDLKIQYNYLNCLIPGFSPKIGGRWSVVQEYYDLDKILNSDKILSKVLGTSLGEIETYKVSDVCRSGVNALTFQRNVKESTSGILNLSIDDTITLINFSNLYADLSIGLSVLGPGRYLEYYNWGESFDIDVINGTNTFPFFGWGGTQTGTLKPQNFQYLQNTLYNYPAFYLEQAKGYNPLGLIYAGQLVQMNSFPKNIENSTFKDRNNRTYKTKMYNNIDERRNIGLLPYQQGRGVFDFIGRYPLYSNITGQVQYAATVTTIPPEGAIPGRNNSFWGMCVSDNWSNTLNMNNIQSGSITADDIRAKDNQAAHNAPLCYISDSANNTDNQIPWNPLLGYVGDTTSSSTNERSANCHILREGITTGVISGAYPLYRGSNSSTWSGSPDVLIKNNGIVLYDQYYDSVEFWDKNQIDPATPQINKSENFFPVQPNPPFRIKGGRIILLEGQIVKAGSYVYSTINMVGNVSMPQFVPPGAKEIILDDSDRKRG